MRRLIQDRLEEMDTGEIREDGYRRDLRGLIQDRLEEIDTVLIRGDWYRRD